MKQDQQRLEIALHKMERYSIDGIGIRTYALMVSLLIGLIHFQMYPKNMLGDLFLMLVLGNLLYAIGSRLPFFNQYLGGGAVFTMVGAALLAMTGIIPAEIVSSVEYLLSGVKFIDFFILSLIVGAILSINSQLMAQAAFRFLPVALISIGITLGLLALAAYLLGFDITYTLLFVGFPIMGGGIGAGAIPLSELYASKFGMSQDYLSLLLPAVILGNIVVIIVSGWIAKWGAGTVLDGYGELMHKQAPVIKIPFKNRDIKDVGVGLMIILIFYMIGILLHAIFPVVNRFAFIIVTIIVVKLSGRLPIKYEQAAVSFSQSMTKNLTHAILAAVGLTKLNLHIVMDAMTWQLVVLVLISVMTITLVAGVVGYLMGLYPLEAAIVAGLVNNSMGGTGNIAVLSAANRMELIGFAQMGNRIGGAVVLVVAGGYLAFLT